MNILSHLQYAKYLLRHKWYVFLECCHRGIIWQGITHDMSKFLPSEWFPYANFFYNAQTKPVRDETGYYKPTDTGDAAFDFAWFLHQKRNNHHWQWWTGLTYSTGKLYNANGGIYICQRSVVQNHLNGKCVGNVDTKAHVKNLCMEESFVISVHRVIKHIIWPIIRSTYCSDDNGIRNEIYENVKNETVMQESIALIYARLYWNITEVIHHLVHVVKKLILSFWQSIILMEMVNNGGEITQEEWEVLLRTDGLLKINSLKASEFSAIIVTQLLDIMITVPITRTPFLLLDNGNIKCIYCNRILSHNEIVVHSLKMSELARCEMLCDWKGAGIAQGRPDTLAWYIKNKHKIQLHPETRLWVEEQLHA